MTGTHTIRQSDAKKDRAGRADIVDQTQIEVT